MKKKRTYGTYTHWNILSILQHLGRTSKQYEECLGAVRIWA